MSKRTDKGLYTDKPTHPNQTLEITLPIPPSVNHMYYGNGRLKREARDYIRDARATINQAIDEQDWIKQPDCTWFYADIEVYFPDRRRRDSHNLLKLFMDVLQPSVFQDDYYCMPRIQKVKYDKGNPRIEAKIKVKK